MKNKPLISVCVPTYKRPRTLEQLIISFIAQPYNAAELFIVDDAPIPDTLTMIAKYKKKDKRIRYIANKNRLGYSKNLEKAMMKSAGKYVFLLGDDDLLIGENILRKYVQIFEKNPKVAFIYSNLLQFNDNLDLTYVYPFFSKDKEFTAGKQTLQEMWLKSTFIGGIGLKKVNGFEKMYPESTLLFPQVELVGKLLLSYNAFGFATYAAGARVHADQLGFHMMNKKRMTGEEKHAYKEIYFIGDRLIEYNKTQKIIRSSNGLKENLEKIVKDFLQQADKSSILAEGITAGKQNFLRTIFMTIRSDKRIRHTTFFWIQLVSFVLLPTKFILFLKESYRSYLRWRYWKKEQSFFTTRKQTIFSHKQ